MTGSESAAATGHPPFHGWRVVWSSFAVLFVGFGLAYSFPAFFDELYREWPGSRRDISFVFGLMALVYFLVGAVAGPLADRFDPRWVIGFGVTLAGAGCIFGSFATELWQLVVAYGVGLGVGIGFAYVPAVAPVQRWFVRKRGLASGLAVAGIGFGTFAAPLIATELIQAWDWRTALLVLGIGGIVIGLAGTVQIISSPMKVHQWPDGIPVAGQSHTAQAPPTGFTLRQAIRTRPFLVLYAGSLVLSFGLFVPFVHLVPSILDQGRFSKDEAVWAVSMIGIGSIAGRFIVGPVADRIGRRSMLVLQFCGIAATYLAWFAGTELWHFFAFGLVFGIFYGGFVALAPAVTVDYLGVRHASGIIGALYTSVGWGTLLGPVLVGELHDQLKDYFWAQAAGMAVSVLGAAILFLLPDPEKWKAAQQGEAAAA